MPTDLPTTPQSAPPNFYSQAGQMAAGAGGPGAAGAGKKGKPSKDDKQAFLEMVTKLLGVFSKMESMKPEGKDISKFTKAMAKTASDCLTFVSTDSGDGSAASTAAGAGSDASGDAGGAAGAASAAVDTGASSAA